MKQRQSNFELLRIVAMMLVLVVHADYLSLNMPTRAELLSDPALSMGRISVEMLAIVCVNLFVFISGWFTIRPSLKGLLKLLFQIFFFLTLGYFLAVPLGAVKTPTVVGLVTTLLKPGWFIISYTLLYCISPILNAFIEKADRRSYIWVLCSFFCLQLLWGTVYHTMEFNRGYSVLSFIGLYLLANALKRKNIQDRWPAACFLITYLVITAVNSGFQWYVIEYAVKLENSVIAYNNPLTIVATVCLFLFFAMLRLGSNRLINWAGRSAFAVYLLHSYSLMPVYARQCREIFERYDGAVYLLYVGAFILLVFAVSVLLDQVRIALWRLLTWRPSKSSNEINQTI